ncbi:glucose dehydrogenase [FAD, quinone]-like [Schistocerca cancellata]|uniref:glucose dehydrogenase [FAD, quinone]-like n=1 Tax=Schistocerca cancellata TaxID=274614 RepID=UPI002118679F|nr:glucose dehydrogenase [FAD, quinone]-like [Schistocerca cancellata]XP_049784927.1 glucose dehydrogenase [FAD, quinone]-like [Schistocerca cancellata]XP_049784928.1 glucose dehydrogenase [FAD, quinone]-like [Schistocerca cancellata]
METASTAHWTGAAATPDTCAVGGAGGALFAQLLATLLHAQCMLGDRSAYPPDTARPLPEYDFVVVGAGSAGATVAARLSENPDWSVLLLEAGGDPPPTSDVPRLFPTLQKTEADWQFETEPDPRACRAHRGGRCAWPRGKALGGSSVLNWMVHVRGPVQDYDAWAALGNDGWSYRDVLPFFRKSQDVEAEELRRRPHAAAVHGTGGGLRVSKFGPDDPFVRTLSDAAREAGQKVVDDFNSDGYLGFTNNFGTVRNGTRWNVAKAFLVPAKSRQNLHVLKHAHVTKVLVDPATKKAYGVQYLKDGNVREVKVAKEVVVSAGAVNTPQVLMLSGIGPKEHLEELGIPVVKDLRVGYNLQDHTIYTGLAYLIENSERDLERKKNQVLQGAFEYLTNRTGILSDTGLTSYQGFVRTDSAPDDDETYSDIQYHYARFEPTFKEWMEAFLEAGSYGDEYRTALRLLAERHDVVLVLPTLLGPTSRGRVSLRSRDPADPVVIEAGYYSDPRDFDNMLAGIRLAHRLGTTEAMRRAGVLVRDVPVAACAGLPPLTDQYWRCAIPHLTTTLYHPAGTAKMGPAADPDAVVDPRLRVHGVRGLRVADASVMPLVVRGNTNVPSVMIGEKCAHMVAEDWRQQ